jgi:hypothetical protein
MNPQPTPPVDEPGRADRWILLATGLMALAPLALYLRSFRQMFWFGDEFDLIDQIDRMGFWHWVCVVFAENFVPLFKLLWGGAVLVFHGSYFAMILLVWFTHAAVVVLLGRVMRRCGLPWTASLFAQVVLALAPANFETLAWTVQWSALLSVAFMLAAIDSFLAFPFRRASYGWVAASALTFSRGVLTGVLLALAAASSAAAGGFPPARRLRLSAGYLAIAAGVAAVIAAFSSGNHHHMQGHWVEALVYGSWYYALNPAYRILGVGSWGWPTAGILGMLKVMLVAWALARSQGRLRLLFALLVASDLGNAVLLGVGRYHTGIDTVISSRYQYASIVGIAPLLGYWITLQAERIRVPALVRRAALAGALAAVAVILCLQWRAQIEPFAQARGVESRRVLLLEPNPGERAVPGIPFMTTVRARELIAAYHLH